MYLCRYSRDIRTASCSPPVHLPCVASPDPQGLTSLSATPSSATSVRVSWVYSANPSTLTSSGGYRIRYRAVSPLGISDAGDVTVSRLISSYTIYGLEEGVRYKITLNAYVGSRNGVSRSTYVTTYTLCNFYPCNLQFSNAFSQNLIFLTSYNRIILSILSAI